jgi:uncharacterized SAM-binding protein YcdF (DUF218 family)
LKQNADPAGKKSFQRGVLVAGIILLLLAVSAFVFRARLLTGAADFLIVDDAPLRPADLIFIFNGDDNSRPFHAAGLYRQGLAPRIAIARVQSTPAENLGLVPNETDISVQVMEKQGVPSDRIVVLPVEGGVASTFDEAVALRAYVEANDIRRIILVTSAFHTRRARWIVDRELAGLPVELEMAAVPYGTFDAADWWKSEEGLVTFNNETIKLVYYYWKYR